MPRTRRVPRGELLLGALALAPFALTLAPPYWVFLATTAAITAIVIRSLGLVTGQAGMISLCQLSFAAVGAWTVGWLNLRETPVPFPLAVLAGGLLAVPFGVLVGLPALRLRGVNLAVVTFGFATATDVYLSTNGFRGANITSPVIVSGQLGHPRTYFGLCWAVFLAVALALSAVGRSRTGAAWLAVRGSERATAAMGISVPATKLSAFAISAGVAGLAGGLLAGQLSILTSAQFSPFASLTTFAIAVMVGARFPGGAAAGGALGTFLPELLRRLNLPLDFGDFLFALGATISLRFQGFGGGAERAHLEFRNRRLRRIAEAAVQTPDAAAGNREPPKAAPATTVRTPLVARSKTALEIRGLTVCFGRVVALDAVDLHVPPRVVSALIGPNGAGKSSLVDAVTGFLPGYEGTIAVDGVRLDRLSVHRRARAGVRRTFQRDRTIAELTIGQYVRLAARRQLDDRELDDLLTFLDCPPAVTPIDTVDVGARRLVEVAGVLAAGPAIALLDEPAAGLAEAESQLLAERIAEIPHRFGCSVLLIEHDMAHVRAASSSVTALSSGRVIASGSPTEVLAHRDVVDTYLGPQVGA